MPPPIHCVVTECGEERSTIAAYGLVAASWSASPPQWVTTAESTEPAWEAERPAPVGLAQGLGIYQVIIAGAVAS